MSCTSDATGPPSLTEARLRLSRMKLENDLEGVLRLHGGDVCVSSTVSKGTTFTGWPSRPQPRPPR